VLRAVVEYQSGSSPMRSLRFAAFVCNRDTLCRLNPRPAKRPLVHRAMVHVSTNRSVRRKNKMIHIAPGQFNRGVCDADDRCFRHAAL